MKDIETREDLEKLLNEFYTVATKDEEIGHHFDDLDLESHLPTITDFWEKVLFGKPIYYGNPFAVHKVLNEKSPLMIEHFDKWVEILVGTVDRNFAGEMAEAMKERARTIAGNLGRRVNETSHDPRQIPILQ